ncbi:hypothetical protein F0562_020366 [Nyssa sinensis]|uniref:Uncharacterized protein n=1 Tax=Nyssa sinensis TaxID=561372 RepID=A0A5J5BVH4_9ASTE|nr:hypothetical protein F0562_020366 [Nyssa sinensis]
MIGKTGSSTREAHASGARLSERNQSDRGTRGEQRRTTSDHGAGNLNFKVNKAEMWKRGKRNIPKRTRKEGLAGFGPFDANQSGPPVLGQHQRTQDLTRRSRQVYGNRASPHGPPKGRYSSAQKHRGFKGRKGPAQIEGAKPSSRRNVQHLLSRAAYSRKEEDSCAHHLPQET